MSSRFEALAGVVAPKILLDAIDASKRLSELGVPHTLIGGLAVGIHGYPRATKDVDYLVGAQAFASTSPLLVYREELRDLVRLGIVDLLAVPPAYPALTGYLESMSTGGEVPVIPVEALILLKLHAHRPQDQADVVALLDAGADAAAVTRYLRDHAPELVARFAELVAASGGG
ncbi:MAG: hypothetical protein HC897_10040 [Thermoanaerobaculia bacterium]|nr:hypothetical protein [Thermoanaerobaculia bacterium]